MQKYGVENFNIEILQDNINSKEELDKYEIYYINYYNSTNHNIGYNIELGGNSIGKHSESTKRKISEAQKGFKNHMFGVKGINNKSSKRVIDITTGNIYNSVTEACEILNLGTKAISKVAACARGSKTSAYNKIFRYLDDNNNPIYVEIPLNTKEIHPILDISTNKKYNTIEEAAKDINVSKSGISQVLLGQRSNIYGHKFIKLNSEKIKIPKKCKVYNLVLEKYKYLTNTVPSSNNLEKV